MTNKISFFCLFILLNFLNATLALAGDSKRSEEVREMMWRNDDPDFSIRQIPDKWKDKSAVIIAKYNMLSYKKTPITATLEYSRYNHYRIMLLDQAAVEEYSQFTIPADGKYGNATSSFFAGFKIVKPDGREIEVPMTSAVKENMDVNNASYNQFKLAIPNLEKGDILDYYFGEERDISISSKYFSFDPVIFQLHGDDPVMKQKITFDVQRRCFINLKSLNGAPDFKLISDDKEDKNTYTLIDEDRESIKDIRWLYANRQIPSIKFKITYASATAASAPTFIGEPGILKSEVSKKEVKDLVAYLFNSGSYTGASLISYMKKNYKKESDLNKLAREAYYAYRNEKYVSNEEVDFLKGTKRNYTEINDVIALSNYYRSKQIPHKILVGVSRHISGIEDLILENELRLILKVDTSEPFYIGSFSKYAMIDEIDESLQGTDAYEIDGLSTTLFWDLKNSKIPVTSADDNRSLSEYQVSLTDLDEGHVGISAKRTLKGANRSYFQNAMMDIYDYKAEEAEKYKMYDNFEQYSYKSTRTELQRKRDDYLSGRDKLNNESLQSFLEDDFKLPIDEVGNLKIEQTGRFDDKPELIYTFDLKVKDAVKRVGKNYLMNVGRLIDGQIHLSDEDRKPRDYDVFQPYPRSFQYVLKIEIPEGYTVQGLEKLNTDVSNITGGFVSTATMEGQTLVVSCEKKYNQNYIEKENWSKMVEFLDAAYHFTQQQVLLKKE